MDEMHVGKRVALIGGLLGTIVRLGDRNGVPMALVNWDNRSRTWIRISALAGY
jgi:preprotein translocase subunit YajC